MSEIFVNLESNQELVEVCKFFSKWQAGDLITLVHVRYMSMDNNGTVLIDHNITDTDHAYLMYTPSGFRGEERLAYPEEIFFKAHHRIKFAHDTHCQSAFKAVDMLKLLACLKKFTLQQLDRFGSDYKMPKGSLSSERLSLLNKVLSEVNTRNLVIFEANVWEFLTC